MNKRLRLGIKILGVLANKVVNNPMPQSVKWYLSQTEEMLSFNFHMGLHSKIRSPPPTGGKPPVRVSKMLGVDDGDDSDYVNDDADVWVDIVEHENHAFSLSLIEDNKI
jgi:hypothetical protein